VDVEAEVRAMAVSKTEREVCFSIRPVDLTKVNENSFLRRSVGCIVLSHDGKILLQQRDKEGCNYPECLATFGGGIEPGETPMQALVRELREELGARIKVSDVINLGAITEALTDHHVLLYVYFWHDKQGTITGCYEGKAEYYNNCATALKHPKIMDDVVWLLYECQYRQLLM